MKSQSANLDKAEQEAQLQQRDHATARYYKWLSCHREKALHSRSVLGGWWVMFTRKCLYTQLAVARVRVRDRVRVSYSQASRVYQFRMVIHMAMSEASRVYSISLFTFHMKVSIYTHGQLYRHTASRSQGQQGYGQDQLARPAVCIYHEWLYTRLRTKLAVCIASAFSHQGVVTV